MDKISFFVSVASFIAATGAAWYAGVQARAARRGVKAAEEQVDAARKGVEAAQDQAEAARRQVALDEKISIDQAQPYVYVDIRPDETTGFLLMLVVENTGPTVAQNVRIVFDPPITSKTFPAVSDAPVLVGGLSSMPPGRRHVFYFDTGPARLGDDELPRRYRVAVTGDGPFGPMAPLEYEIDLNSYLGTSGRASGSLHDVAKALTDLNKTIKSRTR